VRKLAIFVFIVLFSGSLAARTKTFKTFPATRDSVAAENQRADALGLTRYETQAEVDSAVRSGELVPITGVRIDKRLPTNRRYLKPESLGLLKTLARELRETVGDSLMVDSAVRAATIQMRLSRVNRNAAPATGARSSSHERGTTFDLRRRGLSKRGYRFLVMRLLYYRAIGRILVIEERGCFHIFVGGV
jgi:Family of unknown function (DUF5715)